MVNPRGKNRTLLLVFVGLSLVPMLGAWWLLSAHQDSGPWGTTNHGQLLESGTNLEDSGLGALQSLGTKWRLIIVPEADGCSAACRDALPILRALHLRLGKDSTRVWRVLLGPKSLQEESDMRNLRLEHLDILPPLDAGVYIADPFGNLVLRYDWSQVGSPLLKDLEHLLDLSRIG